MAAKIDAIEKSLDEVKEGMLALHGKLDCFIRDCEDFPKDDNNEFEPSSLEDAE